MSKLLVLLFGLVLLASSQTLFRTDGGKVKVDFYYESLCPYCQQFIEKSLKTAAATKVYKNLLRISGKYVISVCILMEMLKEFKMVPVGVLHANMESMNVSETLLKLALSRNMISTLKLFLLLSALKLIQVTGQDQDKDALLN